LLFPSPCRKANGLWIPAFAGMTTGDAWPRGPMSRTGGRRTEKAMQGKRAMSLPSTSVIEGWRGYKPKKSPGCPTANAPPVVILDQKNWIPAYSCGDRLRDRLSLIEDPTPSSSSTLVIEDPEAVVFPSPDRENKAFWIPAFAGMTALIPVCAGMTAWGLGPLGRQLHQTHDGPWPGLPLPLRLALSVGNCTRHMATGEPMRLPARCRSCGLPVLRLYSTRPNGLLHETDARRRHSAGPRLP